MRSNSVAFRHNPLQLNIDLQKVLFWGAIALMLVLLLMPELAHAQSGGNAIKGKIDDARTNWVMPVGIGIMGAGAVISVILWALNVADWKEMGKWCLAAIFIGAIVSFIGYYAY